MFHIRAMVITTLVTSVSFSPNALATASQDAAPPAPATSAELHAQLDELLTKLSELTAGLEFDDFAEIQAKEETMRRAAGDFADALSAPARAKVSVQLAVRDHAMIRTATSPRLTGAIVHVVAGSPVSDLETAIAQCKPGDLIILPQGQFQMPSTRGFVFTDIAIVGQGPERTTLVVKRGTEIQQAARLRLEGMTIQCQDTEFAHLRPGMIHVRDCVITGYNSGAGSSSAINMNGGALLVEGCRFEGRPGRAARSSAGVAFDLRVGATLYARQCQFVNNSEILRALAPAVFDACVRLDQESPGSGVMPYGPGNVILHESDGLVEPRWALAVETLALPTDDLRFVAHAADPAQPIDDSSRELAAALSLHRRIPYWLELRRHEDPDIRALARKRIEALLPAEANVADAAVEEMDKPDERLADLGALLKAEIEFTRLRGWFETHRDKLRWDEATGRYLLEQP